jgi:hypothetical protein
VGYLKSSTPLSRFGVLERLLGMEHEEDREMGLFCIHK